MVIFHSKLQNYQMVIYDDVWCTGVMLDTPAETVFFFQDGTEGTSIS